MDDKELMKKFYVWAHKQWADEYLSLSEIGFCIDSFLAGYRLKEREVNDGLG
jgi:hypothetical protein